MHSSCCYVQARSWAAHTFLAARCRRRAPPPSPPPPSATAPCLCCRSSAALGRAWRPRGGPSRTRCTCATRSATTVSAPVLHTHACMGPSHGPVTCTGAGAQLLVVLLRVRRMLCSCKTARWHAALAAAATHLILLLLGLPPATPAGIIGWVGEPACAGGWEHHLGGVALARAGGRDSGHGLAGCTAQQACWGSWRATHPEACH